MPSYTPKYVLKKGIKSFTQNFEKDYRSPLASQRRTLRQLIRKANNTAFGKHYQFTKFEEKSDLISAFQKTVPFYDYDTIFKEWWYRLLEGEADVCWKGKVNYFGLSSGTTGAASKYIPVTADMTKAMRQAGLRMFTCLPKYKLPANLYLKKWLIIGGSASLENKGEYFVGDLSGINSRKPPLWVRPYFKPGKDVVFLKDWDQRMRRIAEQAKNWDISIVTGIPSWVQLAFEYVINYHKVETIHDIWPNLTVFVTGGTAFEPYRKSLRKIIKKELIYQDSYLASEGFIAYQSRPETHAMKLVLTNGIFYEFVPFNDENFDEEGNLNANATALTVAEIEEGIDYAILITTCSGAWRYLIGDTVRFSDKARLELLITGRTKHFLSVCGEHLSVDNMNQGIDKMEDELDITVGEFCVHSTKVGDHFAHHWYIGSDGISMDEEKIGRSLDKHLMVLNDDYRTERSAMLGAPKVTIIPCSWFVDWQRNFGKMNGQSKIPRVIKKERLNQWNTFIKNKTSTL